jgi:hypothetical protein
MLSLVIALISVPMDPPSLQLIQPTMCSFCTLVDFRYFNL